MELNKANRQVCDIDIRILKTMQPYLWFDTANTTTTGLTSDSVYAMAKGSRRIAFANPLQGTLTIEAQVYPFKFFSLLSDGKLNNTAVYAEHRTIKATTAGELPLAVTGGTVGSGSVFVYPAGSFGDESYMVAGTFANNKFTATTAADIAVDHEYEVGFVVNRSAGVKRISFNNSDLPTDYYITMLTADKDEEGGLTTFLMTAYKACIQRNFELSFSSEGDPATVSLTFDLMEDKNGNILDFVEVESDIEINPN